MQSSFLLGFEPQISHVLERLGYIMSLPFFELLTSCLNDRSVKV